MEAYFAFTDECGSYQKIRTEKFNKTHPFYVRATAIMSVSDYLVLSFQNFIKVLKTCSAGRKDFFGTLKQGARGALFVFYSSSSVTIRP